MGYKGILLLGFATPSKLAEEVFPLDTTPQIATHKFAWGFARAVKTACSNFVLASSVPIQTYPRGRRIVFRSGEFIENGISGFLLGFVNIILLKHISRLFQCLHRLPRYLRLHNVDRMILHGTHTPFMVFAIAMKLWKDTKIFIILTDQHGVFMPGDFWYQRLLKRLDTRFMMLMLRQFDGYICLSSVFIEKFGFNKPVLIFPGIVGEQIDLTLSASALRADDDIFKVVFVGGVNRMNGIDKLLKAFTLINNNRFSLVIYGDGELREEVVAAARDDLRITYGGRVSDSELIPALFSASLLINPKPVDKEYAQTSFPSKLLEYLAVGRPVLTTRVVSIPPEMVDCFLYIDIDTAVGVSEALMRVSRLPAKSREDMAVRAQQTVRSLYSEAVIGRKVVSFVSG